MARATSKGSGSHASNGSRGGGSSSGGSSSKTPYERGLEVLAQNPGKVSQGGSRISDNESVEETYNRGKNFLAGTHDTTGQAITPDKLEKVNVAEIPGVVAPVGVVPDMNITNAGLGDVEGGMFKEYVADAGAGAAETAATDSMNILGEQLGQYLGIGRPDSDANENALADARYESGVAEAQREYNRYQNQINSITAQRDADMLGLEGQGRGITDTIIGGQQARISREAAIMAMPIQAQLAAAQGNLEVAKELMGQLYQAKSADIQADLTYRTNLGNSMMQYATASQQAILQGKMADISTKSQTAQQNLAYQRQLGLQALEYGQNGLITGIAGVDPNSPTFEQDIAAYTSQLRKPVTETVTSDWELKDVDGVSMWVNKYTQETKPAGDTSIAGVDGPGGELDKIALLRDTIGRIKGREANDELGQESYDPLYKAASQTPFTEFFGRTFTGSSDLDNLKVYADTLSSNMLTLATDPEIKKFFGPQMSEADVRMMSASASRLQPDNMTPEQLLSEVKRLEEFVGKYEAAVRAKQDGFVQSANVVVGADGIEYEIIE